MKIRVIIPNSSVAFRDTQLRERKAAAAEGTQVDVICLKHGPVSIEAAYDEAFAAPFIIEEVKKAEKEGYDAVSLDCAMDTVVRAARESVSIPVTSAGEASYLLAMGLCTNFSVITVLKSTVDAIKDNIRKYNLQGRVASVRYTRVPVLELQDEKKAYGAILSEAKKAVEDDSAEAVALGCTGMSGYTKKLSRELGVPVIDPAVASLKLAELYVNMGLASSKIAFENQSGKKIL